MKLDIYLKSLATGLMFHNSRPKSMKLIGAGGWGKVYLIVFTNGMELTIKACSLYYKNYHEIQNIKRLTHQKQSPYVCYYYGYTTVENNKYIFVSKNTNLKFIGELEKMPDKVLKNKIIPESNFSYFNIIMEKLESVDTKNIFEYSSMNIIYFVTFIIGCLKGLRDISKNKIVHGDIHKISNIGFIKTGIDYYAPKLLDFGSIKTSKKAFIDKSTDWKLKTFKKEGYHKWSPEMLGCLLVAKIISNPIHFLLFLYFSSIIIA